MSSAKLNRGALPHHIMCIALCTIQARLDLVEKVVNLIPQINQTDVEFKLRLQQLFLQKGHWSYCIVGRKEEQLIPIEYQIVSI